jgi:xanthine dehydrogenase molybdenum-binding subunit
MADTYTTPTVFNYVNQRGIYRKDGYLKASGRAVYVRDVLLPGMLYAKVMHSPYCHATIKSMDISDAEALPGVRCIIRYDDPFWNERWIASSEDRWETFALPYTNHFFGEGCGAVVAADTEEIAEEAIRLIKAKTVWEELPFVLTADEALASGATIAFPEKRPDGPTNLEATLKVTRGDVEAGFAASDKTLEFTVHRLEENPHCAEPMSLVAFWNGDQLDYWIRDQHNSAIRGAYAGAQTGRLVQFTPLKLEIPMSHITQHVPYQGSSFGAGSRFSRQYCWHVAQLTKRTGRPVRLTFNRAETEQCCSASESLSTMNIKVGFNNDGTIVAVQTNNYNENSRQSASTTCGVQHFLENTSVPNKAATV